MSAGIVERALTGVALAFLALVLATVAAVTLAGLTGCASLGTPQTSPAFLGVPSASPARCERLDDRSTYAGGVAAGAALLGGSAGLSTVATEDTAARLSLAVSSLVFGGLAAGAAFISHDSAATFTKEGCGR